MNDRSHEQRVLDRFVYFVREMGWVPLPPYFGQEKLIERKYVSWVLYARFIVILVGWVFGGGGGWL